MEDVSFERKANALRALAMDAIEKARSGHPGLPMGLADVATVLWGQFLRFDPTCPTWPDRDRLILSAGHGSMLLYALAHLTGYEGMPMEALQQFRQLGSRTPGHPEHDPAIGVEMTTGPLGQGLATAVGFALAERVLAARFGTTLIDHRTFVLASDGDMMEGISHEAASLAGHLKLGRLIVFYDDNKISIDGPTSLSFTEDVPARFRAYGWDTHEVDGHEPAALAAATEAALAVTDRPSLIACRTVIGRGAPSKQGTSGCHGSPLGGDEVAAARKNLGWDSPPFVIPADVLKAWRTIGRRGDPLRRAWDKRLTETPEAIRTALVQTLEGRIPTAVGDALNALKQTLAATKPKKATRQSSGAVLEALMPVLPALLGGSADLTPSNNTRTKAVEAITPPTYAGRYLHFGVREHGMAALMNGLALHGGVIPFGGTFLQFADYMRPAIRLAALMRQRVIFVMTHDSIALGEDGPTHQPVEHLAALRAIPGLLVLRPCDGIETAECWQISLENQNHPSLLALSRQELPTVRGADAGPENRCAQGGYVLAEAEGGVRDVTLLATGSEVSLALTARDTLKAEGIKAAVVSLPCWSLFDAQDGAYRNAVLGTAPRVGIEAGLRLGWGAYLRPNDAFVGLSGFGASAPAEDLARHFGLTPEAVVTAAKGAVRRG